MWLDRNTGLLSFGDEEDKDTGVIAGGKKKVMARPDCKLRDERLPTEPQLIPLLCSRGSGGGQYIDSTRTDLCRSARIATRYRKEAGRAESPRKKVDER